MKVLITGVAGFVGFHLANRLNLKGYEILGIDNLNNYYDIELKQSRLKELKKKGINFSKIDIKKYNDLKSVFDTFEPHITVNLAAQAGVRYSLENPSQYVDSNIIGFFNILECLKHNKYKKLFFASSSSIYGNNQNNKFKENHFSDFPLNLYAASKKTNELMAYCYSNLFELRCVGLRFFTVYGPWGRPDMMYFKFTKNIIEDKEIEVFGNGEMWRDFTYIDDVVKALEDLIGISDDRLFDIKQSSQKNQVFCKILNIGNNKPEKLNDFVNILELAIGKKAKKRFLPVQDGDVIRTSANIDEINSIINFKPKIKIELGIKKFLDWYKRFYNLKL